MFDDKEHFLLSYKVIRAYTNGQIEIFKIQLEWHCQLLVEILYLRKYLTDLVCEVIQSFISYTVKMDEIGWQPRLSPI